MTDVTGIDHIYIAVSGLDRSEAFYDRVLLQVLGFRKNSFVISGDRHIQYFNRHFGYVLRPARGRAPHDSYAPGLHHFCLRVDTAADVAAVAKELRAAGVDASEPRLYPEYAPDYWATFFDDPDGVRLEVTNYRQERRDRHDRWNELPRLDVAAARAPALAGNCDMNVEIESGYVPGAIGRIAELHGSYYHRHAGFGLYFESKVVSELSEFLRRYDDVRDGIWLALFDGRIEGSIAIDGAGAGAEGAHLRWFIVSDTLRGKRAGSKLIGTALDFCRVRKYEKVYLWTFEGLDAARHLYEKHGFVMTLQQRGDQWGSEVNEQQFEWRLK